MCAGTGHCGLVVGLDERFEPTGVGLGVVVEKGDDVTGRQ